MIKLISAVTPELRLWLSTVGQGGDGENDVLFVKERHLPENNHGFPKKCKM